MIRKWKIEENVNFKNSKSLFICLFLLTHGGSTFEKKGFVRFLDLAVSVALPIHIQSLNILKQMCPWKSNRDGFSEDTKKKSREFNLLRKFL